VTLGWRSEREPSIIRGMPNLTIEEGLKRTEDRAAMLRFLAEAAAEGTDWVARPRRVQRAGGRMGEIEELVHSARRSLDMAPLSGDLKRAG
jgi:hypothetical protein